jgi:hypothetical protein
MCPHLPVSNIDLLPPTLTKKSEAAGPPPGGEGRVPDPDRAWVPAPGPLGPGPARRKPSVIRRASAVRICAGSRPVHLMCAGTVAPADTDRSGVMVPSGRAQPAAVPRDATAARWQLHENRSHRRSHAAGQDCPARRGAPNAILLRPQSLGSSHRLHKWGQDATSARAASQPPGRPEDATTWPSAPRRQQSARGCQWTGRSLCAAPPAGRDRCRAHTPPSRQAHRRAPEPAGAGGDNAQRVAPLPHGRDHAGYEHSLTRPKLRRPCRRWPDSARKRRSRLGC